MRRSLYKQNDDVVSLLKIFKEIEDSRQDQCEQDTMRQDSAVKSPVWIKCLPWTYGIDYMKKY